MKGEKKKILVITGSRAEYGLLRSVLECMKKSPKIKILLLVTGSHVLKKFGMTINEIRRDKFPIRGIVEISEKDSMLSALAKEILGIEKFCRTYKPDLALVLGDRDEAFAGAIVAGHLKIPVAHIHGGDLSGPVIDEYIRHAVTKFAHLHFAVSQMSKQRILQLGEEPWRVYCVGAPGLDAIKQMKFLPKQSIAKTFGLDESLPWILCVQHPTTLSPVPIQKQIEPTIRAADSVRGEKIIIYPNSDTGYKIIIRAIEQRRGKTHFHIFPNLPRHQYLHLLKYSDVLVGNSSSGILESGFFRLPTVDIGDRQRGREFGPNVIHAPYNTKKIIKAMRTALSKNFRKNLKKQNNFYGNGTAGKKIVKILEKIPMSQKLIDKKFVYAKHS